jgi:hypothetical protein
MIKGSCLCSEIQYELDEPPGFMNLCHCSMCRKISGSAFGTFAHTEISNYRWLRGESLVSRYESSPGHWRVFCPTCGSSVPSCNEDRGSVCIPAGSFNDDPKLKPSIQIFTGSKAPWHTIANDTPAYEEFEPDDY